MSSEFVYGILQSRNSNRVNCTNAKEACLFWTNNKKRLVLYMHQGRSIRKGAQALISESFSKLQDLNFTATNEVLNKREAR